jgi:hypothetical protein
MTSLASCEVAGVPIPTDGGDVSLEELLLWACMVYHKLFKDTTYQSEQFVERLTFCQKALYRRTDINQDVLVYTVHIPMQSSAIAGQVDWDVDATPQGRWLYANQPTNDTNLTVPTAFQTIKPE